MSLRCKCCHRRIPRRAQNPDQNFCNRKACQNERRRRWRKAKLRTDADYRANQRESHKRWLDKNPDYYRKWRDAHPEYVERNRLLQKGRDRLRKDLSAVTRTGAHLAKSDASTSDSKTITVYYELFPVESENLAKRYASNRLFQLIPVSYDKTVVKAPSCKEITRGTLPDASATPGSCPRPSP